MGAVVMDAADGDRGAWDALVDGYAALVSTMTAAHRLDESDTASVQAQVWRRLDRELRRLRQPDQVGAWLAAVTRDECVRALARRPAPA
jgi:hypothetical protein